MQPARTTCKEIPKGITPDGCISSASPAKAGGTPDFSKYPPAEPEALRLLAPQRGLIAIGQKHGRIRPGRHYLDRHVCPSCSVRNEWRCTLLELSNFYCRPGRAGGTPVGLDREMCVRNLSVSCRHEKVPKITMRSSDRTGIAAAVAFFKLIAKVAALSGPGFERSSEPGFEQ